MWNEPWQTVWQIARKRPEEAAALASPVGVSPLLGQLLLNREIEDEAAARAYLRPALTDLEDPDRLPEMDRAVARIADSARHGERVLVYGDYDVDGVCGSAVLISFLRAAGADARGYLPDRLKEGYGLNAGAVRAAAEGGIDLLVTVDHGTTAHEEIALARSLGLDVVVLDHHTTSGERPPANALVNPHFGDGPGPHPCGTGVAFKVVWGVARALAGGPRVSEADRRYLKEALALVALGTIADLVPLLGENRVLASFGLKALSDSTIPGVRALLAASAISRGGPTVGDVAFRIAPRINAAGRMGSADLALELFLTDSENRAEEIAKLLDEENLKRRKIEAQIVEEACERVEAQYPPGHRGAIVIGDERWHVGVVGIVAARLVDRYHLPAAVVAFDDGLGRGSCRTIPAFHLPKALDRCASLLESHGGHAAAAGFAVKADRFEEFRTAFDRVAREILAPEDLVKKIRVDASVPLSAVTPELVRDLERMEPFGKGNPRPRFVTRGVRVAGAARRIGKQRDHLSFLASDGTRSIRTIGFGLGPVADRIEKSRATVDIAYTPRFDTYRGDGSLELSLDDVIPADGPAAT